MEIFPATMVLMLVWLVLCLRDPDNAVFLTIAALPFGMFAAVVLTSFGGLSLLAANVLAMLAVGLALLRQFAPSSATDGARSFDLAVVSYGIFTAYAVFSAFVVVRFFEGQFLVFPLSRTLDGVRVDFRFYGIMAPLKAGPSNVSQSAYMLLSFGFFVVALHWFRRQGAAVGERAIRTAAWINIILGVMDFLKMDALLEWIRTATYALGNQHTFGVLERVIGGYPEPSTFGSNSAAFFGYFAAAFVYNRTRKNAVVALLSLALAFLSLSATGYLAVGAVLAFLLWHSRRLLFDSFDPSTLLIGIGSIFLFIAAAALLILVSPVMSFVSEITEVLFLNKAESVSGLERGAWARSGIDAFWETRWLGAGAGSLRSNGLIPVLLGNVGLPGLLACSLFIYASIFRRAPAAGINRAACFSAQSAALALLVGMFVAATGPDLGLTFVTFAAFATAARAARPSREATPLMEALQRGQLTARPPLRR